MRYRTYLIASDDNGLIAAKRMKPVVMTTEMVHDFAHELFPNARIYGETERAPRGSRRLLFYQSPNKDGVGRCGRNWTALSLAAAANSAPGSEREGVEDDG